MRHYHSYDNRRGNSYGAGMRPGCSAHTRGWHAGVEVYVGTRDDDKDRDEFAVWMTTGSGHGGPGVLLGTVRETADGPEWLPASLRAEALGVAGLLPADASSLGEPEVRALRVLIRQLRGWGRRLDERQAELNAEAVRQAEREALWEAEEAALRATRQAELDAERAADQAGRDADEPGLEPGHKPVPGPAPDPFVFGPDIGWSSPGYRE